MSASLEATTPTELVDALFQSTNAIEFVPRTLLVSTLGVTYANRFLPELPEYVAINVQDFQTVVHAYLPELVPVTSS